jgi:hypothetical protein
MSYTLLITDIAPSSSHTAGVMLNQFISHFGEDSEIGVYNIHSDGLSTYKISDFVNGGFRWARKPNEYWVKTGPLKILGDFFAQLDCKYIVADILRQISRNMPDQILVVVQGQTMIRIALALNDVGIEFSTIHWDPYSWWAHHNRPPKRLNALMDQLKNILRERGTHILPSRSYARYLGLDKDNFVVINLAFNFFHEQQVPQPSVINLCFSGQNYAFAEIEFVFQVLNKNEWKINNVQVKIHTYGPAPLPFLNPNIIHHGWFPPEKLIEELSKHDAAILPYPSAGHFSEVSEFSFPSKFATYIAANLPVIFVGDQNNPLQGDFAKVTEFIHVGRDLDLLNCITRIQHLKASQSHIRRDIFQKYFSVEAQRRVVEDWMLKRIMTIPSGKAIKPAFMIRQSRNLNQFVYPSWSLGFFSRITFLLNQFSFDSVRALLMRTWLRAERYRAAGQGLLVYYIYRFTQRRKI